MDFTEKTEQLIGKDAVEYLHKQRVAVFGVGGVGGAVVEALARAGIGKIAIVDKDEVSLSNINRQIIALHSTIGRKKVDVMKERIQDISSEISVEAYPEFFLPENHDFISFEDYDYIVDAVDTVTAKLLIIERAKEIGIPVISAMGAGNRIFATDFRVAKIEKTSGCPLARVMRRELRARNLKNVKCVYSPTEPNRFVENQNDLNSFKIQNASISFVPPVMGYLLVGEVVRDLLKNGGFLQKTN